MPPAPGKRGGLNGSVQHWLEVYSQEFQNPRHMRPKPETRWAKTRITIAIEHVNNVRRLSLFGFGVPHLFETGGAGTLALFAGYVSFETLNSFASIRLIYAPERAPLPGAHRGWRTCRPDSSRTGTAGNSELLHPHLKSGALHSKPRCGTLGPRNNPAALFERRQYLLAFGFFENTLHAT
jgi:hypothetical protein